MAINFLGISEDHLISIINYLGFNSLLKILKNYTYMYIGIVATTHVLTHVYDHGSLGNLKRKDQIYYDN